jgi:MFS family permease
MPLSAFSPARSRYLSVAALVMTVIGTLLGALAAWLFYQSGTHCRDGWPTLIAVSYLLLIMAPVAGVVIAHIALHQARSTGQRASVWEIAAVATSWSVFAIVGGVAGIFALMMILFSNGLPC